MRIYPASYYFDRKTAQGRRQLSRVYTQDISVDACHDQQLDRFNQSWQLSLASSPWARALQQRYDLADRFASWETFQAQVPELDKPILNQVIGAVPVGGSGISWRATGGTSGAPFRFPVTGQEHAEARTNMAWFRHTYGVDGGARIFLLWGHSHLLGSGPTGALNRLGRAVSDTLMGYRRFSAYDLSESAMHSAGDAMATFRPDCFIGYTRAIEQFVRVNAHRKADFSSLKLVQPTGEGYSSDDSRAQVEDFFAAPVRMEYGTVETGPIAYQAEAGFRPLWLSHHLEILPDQSLAVTSLYPRALPLLRYRIGDFCESETPNLLLEKITGRVNDFIELSGKRVHSELISHAVRNVQNVTGYQLVVNQAGGITLNLTAPSGLGDDQRDEILKSLIRVEPALENLSIESVNELISSPSGKRPMVVRL